MRVFAEAWVPRYTRYRDYSTFAQGSKIVMPLLSVARFGSSAGSQQIHRFCRTWMTASGSVPGLTRLSGLVPSVWGFGFRVGALGFRFRVWGLTFRV